MIKIKVNSIEVFNSDDSSFSKLPEKVFRFEHSLKSISKWEQKWNIRLIPAMERKTITQEQLLDYCCCMCLDEDFNYLYLTKDVVTILVEYMNRKQTATTFHSQKNTSSKGKHDLSSEEIYARMILANIPFECEEWNIERLFTLMNAVSILSGSKKKMNQKDVMAMYSKMNEQNRKKYNSRG